jgi:WD40 repeat protein
MQVVSGSCDRTVRVWDWKMAGEISRTFYGHTDKVCSVAFLPNGKQVVSASFDNTIRIWKV